MRRRDGRISLGVLAVALVLGSAGPGDAEAAFQWAAPYVSMLAGYDSNVRRLSTSAPPAGQQVEGDGRAVLLASLGARYTRGERLQAALEARPYFVKYFDLDRFDRADGFGAGELFYEIRERWKLEVIDRFRYTYFTGRGFDRLYDSLQPSLGFSPSSRLEVAAQYRYMYRDNPRRIIDWWQANGVGGSVGLEATDRLSLEVFGRVDFQSMQFVFPRDNHGERYWADVSARYLAGSRVLLMGKYLYQSDEMEFAFAPGVDLDRYGDPSDDFADGILQSLRFTEDTDNNYRKHLLVVLSHVSVGGDAFVEAFFLYQHKRFDQRVTLLPDRPQRLDRTYVGQVYLLAPVGRGLSLLSTLRFERNDSTDPRVDYRYAIAGAGLRWTF